MIVRHLIIVVEVTFADRSIGVESQLGAKQDGKSIFEHQEKLAEAFHALMQEGQEIHETGGYQQGFFMEVIKLANWDHWVSFPLFIMAFHD